MQELQRISANFLFTSRSMGKVRAIKLRIGIELGYEIAAARSVACSAATILRQDPPARVEKP
jgi:hypothetical protein